MSEPLCSNKLLDDAKRAIANAKQLRDNGDQLKEESRKLNQRYKDGGKRKGKS